jgi:hypothetical protein
MDIAEKLTEALTVHIQLMIDIRNDHSLAAHEAEVASATVIEELIREMLTSGGGANNE